MIGCSDCGHILALRMIVNGTPMHLCGSCADVRDHNGETIEGYPERDQDEDDGVTYGDPRDEMDERMAEDWR